MLDTAFEALKTFDWGKDLNALKPIDDAVVSTHGDAAARKELEDRLAASLKEELPLDARQVVCRHLMVVGTAASVPALAAMLADEKISHMARYALERIPAAEAAQALRDALATVNGALKVGVISSLGARQDADSVPLLAKLLTDSDPAVAQAAAAGLGAIRSADAATALAGGEPASQAQSAAADAKLACAEAILAAGNGKAALVIYKSLMGADQPKHVKLAATRGVLACAGKQ